LNGLRREVPVKGLLPVNSETLRHQEVIDWMEHVTFNVVESFSAVTVPVVCQPASSSSSAQ